MVTDFRLFNFRVSSVCVCGYHRPANMPLTEKIIATFVLWAAGAGLFFYLLNRWVLFTRDFRIKPSLLLVTFTALTAGSVWHGWRAGYAALFWVALVLLALELLGEVRLHWLRRKMAGAPPVWQENVAEQLAQPFTTTTLAVRHYAIRLPHWRGPRLRIAHVTDLHLNGMLPDAHYRLVMERVRQAVPDLILLTGDFVSDEVEYAAQLPGVLAAVRGKLGTFAILGNHDHWSDPAQVTAALKSAGVQTLEKGFQTLEIGGQAVTLWGCEDPWGPTRWSPPAKEGAAGGRLKEKRSAIAATEAGGLVLALSHTADNIYRLAKAGAHVVFSGHYHAGQWRLPWIGPLMLPSRFGRRFAHGHFVVRGTHLFVSAGVGLTRLPFRIYCRPDIFIVDILPGKN
jgi:hypothetical protein